MSYYNSDRSQRGLRSKDLKEYTKKGALKGRKKK